MDNFKDNGVFAGDIPCCAPIAVWRIDKDGVFETFIGKPLCMAGYEASSMTGKNIFQEFHENREILDSHRKALTGENACCTAVIGERIFDLFVSALKDSESVCGAACVAVDVTEKNAELSAISRLASIGRMAAKVAHDINNPVTIIKGNSFLLKEGMEKKSLLGERESNLFTKLEKSVERIVAIANALKTYVRGHDDDVRLISINSVLKDALFISETLYHKENASVNLNIDSRKPIVKADYGVLLQAVIEFLNAIKDGIPVKISGNISIATYDNETSVIMTIGCNCPDILTSANIHISSFSSTIKFLGGLVWLETVPTGNVVYIKFQSVEPGAGEIADAGIIEASVPDSTDPVRALVLDDEPAMCEVLGTYLSSAGYEVTCVSSSKDALRMIKDSKFDIVFTDMIMPDMSGDDFIRESKGLPGAEGMMFVAVTGIAGSDYANAYLEKPFDKADVIRLLNELGKAGSHGR